MTKKHAKKPVRKNLRSTVSRNLTLESPIPPLHSRPHDPEAESTLQVYEEMLDRVAKDKESATQTQDTRSAEALAQEATTAKRTTLIAEVRELMARGLEANLEAGRKLNELKPLFPHGDWVPFLKAEAERYHLSFRTLQEYMRLARETDAAIQKEIPAFFPAAIDSQAQTIGDAGEQAQKQVAIASKNTSPSAESQLALFGPTRPRISRPRLNGICRVSLYLTGNQKDNLDALQASEHWPEAAQEIVATLERLFVHYGLVNSDTGPEQLSVKAGSLSESYEATDDDIPTALYIENTQAKEVSEHENLSA